MEKKEITMEMVNKTIRYEFESEDYRIVLNQEDRKVNISIFDRNTGALRSFMWMDEDFNFELLRLAISKAESIVESN